MTLRDIARSCWTGEPIDDAEWSARIKDAVARLRRPYPSPEDITRAIRAVERDVNRPLPTLPSSVSEPVVDEKWPTMTDRAARGVMLGLEARLSRIRSSAGRER